MIEERGPWPGITTLERMPDFAAEASEYLMRRLRDPDLERPMKSLEQAGCEVGQLFDRLVRIRRSTEWEPISKSDLDDAIQRLERAKRTLNTLKRSEAGRQIFDHLQRADRLIAEIEWVCRGAKSVSPTTTAKHTPRSDSAIAALVTYVRQTTGAYHDEDASALIGGALEEEERWTSDNLRQWRYRRGLTSDR